jgi:hypothetical protein
MYFLWLQAAAIQALVCVLVFLTVWLIAQTPLIDLIPRLIKPQPDMHVPHYGEEYKHLALDITTIFFFAIVFYYCLMLSVAHETRMMTEELQAFDRQEALSSRARTGSGGTRKLGATAAFGGFAATQEKWGMCKKHFNEQMTLEMQNVSSPEYVDIQRLLGGDFEKFPLWHYLRLNIRLEVVDFFTLSWQMWAPVVLAFIVLMCLHRFAHMGYVRIMGVFGIMLLFVISGMAWQIGAVAGAVEKSGSEEGQNTQQKQTVHNRFNTESAWIGIMQFCLFFVCYGAARMICQSWMWELHFWPVFCLTVLAIVSAILFVWLVAPVIPMFCAVMAMPPYVDPTNIMMMKHVATQVSEGKYMAASSPR